MSSSERSRPDGDPVSGVALAPDRAVLLAGAVAPPYARWLQRVVAAVLDNAILAGVTWLALGGGSTQPTLTPGYGPVGDAAWPDDPLVLVPIGAVVLLLTLQALTGWTPGKLVVGIRVVRERSGGPAGWWTTLVRWVLHLLDAILLIGYLRPLWHAKRQTFADTIAHTVVVQHLPDLSRRPRIAVYSAALVAVVLGLAYGCVPISSSRSEPMAGLGECGVDGVGPALTGGDISLGGSVSIEQDRRMWTVRETRTARPAATLSWASEPAARDVDYRIVLSARSLSERGTPPVSRSWEVGADDEVGWSTDGSITHTRTVSPDGDVHVAEVELTDPEAMAALGADLLVDVRLTADGAAVAECGGSTTR
ncbi:RDD family protein [Promicromonospora iranensis]|uniref:Mce-associated membrane protein n=1 Tax=Promicromonospora iranensis TaxID=1105144 RepID=A0ABU2CPB3_9MICO|nr:RDD family protein [Promicromonospora iranensis]MDR7383181.1 Mce-associated membrane protein [Promicromonospora iranensis]